MEDKNWRGLATRDHLLLLDRLRSEGETELARKIEICGNEIQLQCIGCGAKRMGFQRCKRKWCPYCAKVLAAKRSGELELITRHFQWPLFVTLTMRNQSDLSSDAVRTLRRAFGKLRHKKLWSQHVAAGIACIEVTNIGNGWHPHLHAVLDCQFLAHKTPLPQRGDTVERKKELFQQAAIELESAWAKCLKQETASVKIKRCNASTIAKEVVKYAVKGSDLIDSQDPIGEIIRCIERTRLLTTFGAAHGQCTRDLRKQVKAELAEANRVRNNEQLKSTPKNINDRAGDSAGTEFKHTDSDCCSSPCCVPFSISEKILFKTSFHVMTLTDKPSRSTAVAAKPPSCRADFTGGKLGRLNFKKTH
jgi:hypothetical protein